MKNTPRKRDFLAEAYKIHCGDRKIKVSKKHVQAVVDRLFGFMDAIYQTECKKRNAAGLPNLPLPKELRGYLR